MPECPALQSGAFWHPYNSPPLMGGDKGEGELLGVSPPPQSSPLPARASQWQAGIEGEEVA